MDKAWILTTEYNDYDQHGAYFVAWWPEKPTVKQLLEYLYDEEEANHVLSGGSRRGVEHQWFELRQYRAG